jgi:rubrerythrin
MSDVKSAEEVFAAAMAMERVGKEFYAALAMASDRAEVREFCRFAAAAEARHFSAFRQMRDAWLGGRRAMPLAPETAEKLRALVKANIQPEPQEVRKVGMQGSLKDALDMAIRMEKDSIAFYQGILTHLPDLGAQIRPIIIEENSHLRDLEALHR